MFHSRADLQIKASLDILFSKKCVLRQNVNSGEIMNGHSTSEGSAKSFRHILLTRFNARFSAKWTGQCLDPDWLDRRFLLFRKYCYPSVRNQTTANFTWLVFFHEDTPLSYRRSIQELTDWPVMHPVYSSFLSRDKVMESIYEVSQGTTSHIISSSLDNDDAICRTYIEEIQKKFCGQDYQYVNWETGYVFHAGRFYFRKDLQSPFNTLIAQIGKDTFVWDVWHTKILETGPVIQIDSGPGWLQVIHETNISNRIRGRRILCPSVSDPFPFISGTDVKKDNWWEMFLDVCLLNSLRFLRELVVRILKHFVDLQYFAYVLQRKKRANLS